MDIIKNTDSNSELLTKIVEDWGQKQNPSFDELTSSVLQTHQTAQAGAIRAVNQMATKLRSEEQLAHRLLYSRV